MRPIVVFPVCVKDIGLARLHSRWLKDLGHRNAATALVFEESGCDPQTRQEMMENLSFNFHEVLRKSYARLQVGGWPLAPNMVFQMAARTMSKQCLPWLWFEPDAVALKPDWVDQLFKEYGSHDKPFMGCHVDGMSHVNGTAIYPPQTPILLPSAMAATKSAWDYDCAEEMLPHTHNAGRTLMQHVWTIRNGKFSPVGGGDLPVKITPSIAKSQIRKEAVMIHRIKDESLLKLLLNGTYRP